jgi:ABC-type branched-subunit amino acid transport system ATPase component
MQPTAIYLLQLKHVYRNYGGIKAISDVSFNIAGAGITGLIGPNGAGKTTLFNVIAGSVSPSAGEIFFEGKQISGKGPDAIARSGLVRSFQSPMLLPGLTVREHIYQAATLPFLGSPLQLLTNKLKHRQVEIAAHVDRVIAFSGLQAEADHIAESMAYGLQKILGIAMALAARPKLLLADEPAAGLNGAETIRMSNMLKAINTEWKIPIIVIEHDMGLVMRLCHRIIVLSQGALIADGAPDVVKKMPAFIEAYLGAEVA